MYSFLSFIIIVALLIDYFTYRLIPNCTLCLSELLNKVLRLYTWSSLRQDQPQRLLSSSIDTHTTGHDLLVDSVAFGSPWLIIQDCALLSSSMIIEFATRAFVIHVFRSTRIYYAIRELQCVVTINANASLMLIILITR